MTTTPTLTARTDQIEAVRAFNRFYTARIGALRDGLLATPYPLPEARILFELGRRGTIDAMHLEAFHQAEVLYVDERGRLDPWRATGQVLQSVNLLLPGRAVKIVPTAYAMCSEAWELAVEDTGGWFEVLAWGIFTDRIVRHLGGDPERHTAVGVGHGLERLAMLRYGIDDIRKIEAARVA